MSGKEAFVLSGLPKSLALHYRSANNSLSEAAFIPVEFSPIRYHYYQATDCHHQNDS